MKPKTVLKKKTLKLKIEENADYRMIGISSHENDYRLVWAINNQMKMQFVRIDNLVIIDEKSKLEMEFSRYLCPDEGRYLKYYLISNRCPNGYLFPELRNLDFLLQVVGDTDHTVLEEMAKSFRKIEIVSAVFTIRPEQIRNIERIVID
jgi:hypothetical protein